MRRIGFACALTALAVVSGAAQGIKATVLAGAGGYVRSDCITPVMVILEKLLEKEPPLRQGDGGGHGRVVLSIQRRAGGLEIVFSSRAVGPDGDLDGDCFVGFIDFSILANEWLQ